MHALLFRKWQNRVKGRDWYDMEWYNAKINTTKIENAKEDVIRFVKNPNELDIWSRDYFNQLVENLKVDK